MGLIPTPLTLALRAYVTRQHAADVETPSHPRQAEATWPVDALIIDVETTTDATQRLLFGWYRHVQWQADGTLACLQEGLIYADDLPGRDPAAYAALRAFATTYQAEVISGQDATMPLRSRAEFVAGPLWDIVHGACGLVVGFNLPFDLTRLATDAAPTRRHGKKRKRPDWFAGGFSLTLWPVDPAKGRKDSAFWPRLRLKHIDSKRSLLAFGSRLLYAGDGQRKPETAYAPGRFLDLKTLVFALTDQSHSLASACEAFGMRERKAEATGHGRVTTTYIEYARQDVRATAALLEAGRHEFDRHPVNLLPDRVRSPASMAKAYLRALGLQAPRVQFQHISPEHQGQAMTAYYGGRAEARIRNMIVPVIHCDFLSMYPTVNALLGLWDLLSADSLRIVDATADVQALLDRVTLEGCFDPTLWRELRGYALVQPAGDILPTRAQYDAPGDLTDHPSLDHGFTIGVNPLESTEPLWFPLPDIVDSTLLTGRPPRVLEAWHVVPEGRQTGLTPVNLRRDPAGKVDPTGQDPFCRLVEARQLLKRRHDLPTQERRWLERALKVTANSGSYGIFAEVNPVELGTGERETVRVFGRGQPFDLATTKPEEPGEFCFPIFAALTTSGARLMLGLLECAVREHGGHYAFCDTDSLAIVASEQGGVVPCDNGTHDRPTLHPTIPVLSRAQVEAIVERFERLNPYDRAAVPGSVLKIEELNKQSGQWQQLYCIAISAKRYALFNLSANGAVVLRKPSEHGLGHLLNPTRGPGTPVIEQGPGGANEHWPQWIGEAWRWMIAQVRGEVVERPVWFNRPAISRITMTSPRLLATFAALNRDQPYADQVKPMNFGLLAHLDRLRLPLETRPDRFQLVAPYESDASQWASMRWLEKYSGRVYYISTDPSAPPSYIVARTIGDELERYGVHPEPKSADAQGMPCMEATVGLLQRWRVRVGNILYIGKEANRLEEVNAGLVTNLADVLAVYRDPTDTAWQRLVVPLLQCVPVERVARTVKVSDRQVKYYRSGEKQPAGARRRLVLKLVRAEARRLLRSQSTAPELHNIAEQVLTLY